MAKAERMAELDKQREELAKKSAELNALAIKFEEQKKAHELAENLIKDEYNATSNSVNGIKHSIQVMEFRNRLENEAGLADHPKADMLWEKAKSGEKLFRGIEEKYKFWAELLK